MNNSADSHKNSKVVLRSINTLPLEAALRDLADACDFEKVIPKGCRVVVKVNLSTPVADMAYASNTSPELLDGVLALLKERTDKILVGESNGMRYDTEDAFEVSGYYPILKRHGVEPISFTKDKWVDVDGLHVTGWKLPKSLVEADVFVTLPVLKTHATTVFTGALKNQFGCYPQHDRILLHPHLDEAIVRINSILNPQLVIMDAITGMEGRGPINGKPRKMNVVLGSRDPVALDATAMRLVGLDPYTSRHIVMAGERGLGNIDPAQIEIDGDFAGLQTVFEPAERDFPIRLLGLISHSEFLVKNLILNPESFYPLRSAALTFRSMRDSVRGMLRR